MFKLLKAFAVEEDGLGTVEIVIILAVLVSIAMIFKNTIVSFVKSAMQIIFPNGTDDVIVREDGGN
jgi:Flp pilus assembly pilin Flp